MKQLDLIQLETRYTEMREQFLEHHRAKPEIWREFCKLAFRLINNGREHYGSAAILEVVRYHKAIEHPDGEFRVNNNTKSFYARMFALKFPEHSDFFEFRRQTSHERAASNQGDFRPPLAQREKVIDNDLAKYVGEFDMQKEI